MIQVTARLACVLVMPIALYLCLYGVQIVSADVAFARAENEVAPWGKRGYVPTQTDLVYARTWLDRARELRPREPAYLRLDVLVTGWEDQAPSSASAIALQQQLVSQRPASFYAWQKLVTLKEGRGAYDAWWRLAVKRATQLAPAAAESP